MVLDLGLPKIYATIDGVRSAREIARLCTSEHAYRWLCGGVGVNHHALGDFRTAHEALLDRRLTDSVTALASDGLIVPPGPERRALNPNRRP